jgi:hypothetical protein
MAIRRRQEALTMRERHAWAYCDVRPDGTITYYGVAGDHRTQARPNIQAVDARRWTEEAVAWLGLQGWELVAVVPGEGPTFYFKRPIDEQVATLEIEQADAAIAGIAVSGVNDVPDDDTDRSQIDPVRLIEEEFLPE